MFAPPPFDEIGVGEHRATDGHRVGIGFFDEANGFLTRGRRREAAVGDHLPTEACPQLLHQFAGRLLVQHRQIRQADGTQPVDEGAVDSAHILAVGLERVLDVVFGRDAQSDPARTDGVRHGGTASTTRRIRFSTEPPYSSVRRFEAGDRNSCSR